MECYETVMRESDVIGRLEEVLDFVVEHQHDGTASTSEDVGEGSLEEGSSTFLFGDSGPAVSCALVDDFALGSARLHHHTPTHSIEGIGNNTGHSGYSLCNSP